MKKIFLLSLLFVSLSLFAQEKAVPTDSLSKKKGVMISKELPKQEQEIKALFDKILTKDTHDADRIAINEQIAQKLALALKEKGSFLFNFDSLKNLGKVYSDDYNIRVYTWCCEMEDMSYRFYGFVQNFQTDIVYPLVQSAPVYIPADDQQILPKKWYGALYYKVIKVQGGADPAYIMLGWSQPNKEKKVKIMEVLNFDEDRLMLGSRIFKGYKGKAYRFVFSYCSDLTVSLSYDEKLKRFVFDHLTPLSDEHCNDKVPVDEYGRSIPTERPIHCGCNGPDMSYDSLKQRKKNWFSKKYIWVLKKDVDAKNDK